MPKKTFTPEQIVNKLRQVEVLVSQGKTVPLACKEAGQAEAARETVVERWIVPAQLVEPLDNLQNRRALQV